ncbi:hypothetical protein [Sphingomonas spermidinifaciens]|uniref:hypothetical protein n=1 Tax=Sphingomonas spermidinifaciens TaxID=1141889 RepID=UPI001142F8D3|nr:hypothetical protein [Sphingomonas spermidinifaciens]
MRDNRRTGRLALAVAAAMFAGLLTAWAEPSAHNLDTIEREIALIVRDVRSDAAPPLTVVDQALPVARTIVSKSQ